MCFISLGWVCTWEWNCHVMWYSASWRTARLLCKAAAPSYIPAGAWGFQFLYIHVGTRCHESVVSVHPTRREVISHCALGSVSCLLDSFVSLDSCVLDLLPVLKLVCPFLTELGESFVCGRCRSLLRYVILRLFSFCVILSLSFVVVYHLGFHFIFYRFYYSLLVLVPLEPPDIDTGVLGCYWNGVSHMQVTFMAPCTAEAGLQPQILLPLPPVLRLAHLMTSPTPPSWGRVILA